MPTTRPSLLRRDLDVARIRSRFQQNGIVEVREALSCDWAARMHRFLAREILAGWWTVAIRAGGDPEYFSDTPANRPRIREAYQRARKELRSGNFSYCFRRTLGDHLPDCHCQECQFRVALEGDEMSRIFSRIGLPAAVPAEMFASRYSRGSFPVPSPRQRQRPGGVRVESVAVLAATVGRVADIPKRRLANDTPGLYS